MDKVRKNLWTLTGQSDVVEATGEIEDFGGEKDVEGNLAKAIFGLLCVGTVLGVNVPKRLGQIVFDLAGNGESGESASSSEASASSSDKHPAAEEKNKREESSALAVEAASQPAAVGAGDPVTASATACPAEAVGAAPGSNENREPHEKALRGAKTRMELNRAWKHGVATDAKLGGADKAYLYTVYKECLGKFTQK